MSWRRNVTLGLVAGGLAAGGFWGACELAEARQTAVVVVRFLLGYYDGRNRFVPTSGRNATNVDRNALVMFLFSGPIDSGPNRRASLPLTLSEQAELAVLQAQDPDFDLAANGYEPGVIPRKRSTDRGAYFVATGTVNPTTVVIASPQAGGVLSQAPGQYFKSLKGGSGERVLASRLVFNPRYNVSAYNLPHEVDYNPAGYDATTTYQVYIDGGPNPEHAFELLQNLDGRPLSVPFSTTFTTGRRYVQDYTRPQIRESSPVDRATNVTSDADVELTFSEPMDISSFVPPRFQGDNAATVIVRYSESAINGSALQLRNLLIQPRVKPQTGGNVIQLRPLQGFGKGPYEIEVIVTTAVSDLSGNNIARQIVVTFQTQFNPAADQAGFLEEKFDNTTYQDTTFQIGGTPERPSGDNAVALWNPKAQPGFVTGVVSDTEFVAFSPNQTASGINFWGSYVVQGVAYPIIFQNMYTVNDMGARPRLITSFAWRNIIGGTFTGSSYPNCQVQIGHANDIIASSGFPGTPSSAPPPSPSNFRDTPTLVHPAATYSTLGKLRADNYVSGPVFSRNFNFDGQNPVILEVSHNGNPSNFVGDYWQYDRAYPVQCATYQVPGPNPPISRSIFVYFDTKFTFVTPGAEAQSIFYDLGRGDARLIPQILNPLVQPQGTSITFVFEGAKENAVNPNIPDLSTRTGWVPDVRALSNYRYIRFRATMLNNLQTKAFPSLDNLLIPYTYR